MKKRILSVVLMLGLALALSACWPGEIGVTTIFNADGSGERTIVLDVMDDTLSNDPIINPDDPDQTEGKGAVINNKHIDGGLPAIQTWLEENAPDFITVEPSTIDGYHRYFTLTYTWDSWEDFLAKYEELVNLSPNLSWSDFNDDELPKLTVSGLYKKEVTFSESKAIVEASLDWAIDGIWNDIYVADDLAGFVTKSDISVLAGYTVKISDQMYQELPYFDPDAEDGEGTGKRIFVESNDFTLTGTFTNTGAIVGTLVGGLALLGGAVFVFMKIKK